MSNLAADIFGGTFDPVQAGHLELIKTALTPGRVLVVAPTTQNPWKDRPATPLPLRLEMLRIAFQAESIPFTEDRPEPGLVYLCQIPYKRSVELLRAWREVYGNDIRWLVGPGDKASSENWLNWKEEGCPVLELKSSYPYHSTDVRNGTTAPHPAIEAFIERHVLYREEA
jgi:cytidyltransferase-like protein